MSPIYLGDQLIGYTLQTEKKDPTMIKIRDLEVEQLFTLRDRVYVVTQGSEDDNPVVVRQVGIVTPTGTLHVLIFDEEYVEDNIEVQPIQLSVF